MSNNKRNREYIFTTTDPLGSEVRLKSSTWYNHIIGRDNDRFQLKDNIDIIKKIIEDPYFILPNNPDVPNSTKQKYIDIVNMEQYSSLMNIVIVAEDHAEGFKDIATVIPKKRLTQESTKGGVLYDRSKST